MAAAADLQILDPAAVVAVQLKIQEVMDKVVEAILTQVKQEELEEKIQEAAEVADLTVQEMVDLVVRVL